MLSSQAFFAASQRALVVHELVTKVLSSFLAQSLAHVPAGQDAEYLSLSAASLSFLQSSSVSPTHT